MKTHSKELVAIVKIDFKSTRCFDGMCFSKKTGLSSAQLEQFILLTDSEVETGSSMEIRLLSVDCEVQAFFQIFTRVVQT